MSTDSAEFSVLPGTKFRTRANDDGTLDILDVPIFSTVPQGVKGAPKDIEEADLRTAVAVHRRKHEEDQFLARTNAGHNQALHKPQVAGFFLPTAVRRERFGGESRPVVFADLLHVPMSVVERIKMHELPYRSVEVREWEPLEFGALALLDTEPPFFQLAMMLDVEEDSTVSVGADVTRFNHVQQAPAVAAFVAGTGARFLFRFEDDMPEDEKKKDDDNTEAEMQEGGGAKAAVSDIEALLKELEPILALKDKILEMVGGGGGTEEEMPTEDEMPVELSKEKKAAMSHDSAKAEARLAAVENKLGAMEREKRTERMFATAVEKLEASSIYITDTYREKLFSAAGKGEETLKLFVDAAMETARRDPPDSLDGSFGGGEPAYPNEVMKFAADSPAKFNAAKEAFSEWRELRDDKFRSPMDRYIERAVKEVG